MPRKLPCTVESITDHGGQVYSVDLIPHATVPAFRPGQFLHLTVDAYDPSSFWPESRVFSIASSPRDRSRLRICYSVKGRYTAKMERTLRAGGHAWVKLPYGDFVIDEKRDAVLIAGGTGITAFSAFLEGLTPDFPRRVTVVYGARTASLLLFQDMILSQLAAIPNFDVVFFTESQDDSFSRRMCALPHAPRCFPGRISLSALTSPVRPPMPSKLSHPPSGLCPVPCSVQTAEEGRQNTEKESLTPAPLSSVFYLSGPPAMLTTLTADLQQRGIPADRIRTDAWE